MIEVILRYTEKLRRDRSVDGNALAFAVRDDNLIAWGDPRRTDLASTLLRRLSHVAICVAKPSLPFGDLLIQAAMDDTRALVPEDSETRTFLHDIPILRAREVADDPAAAILPLLGRRKGILVEGLGIVATGAFTIEQAYVNYSSIFHATFVKFLQDLALRGYRSEGERAAVEKFRHDWLLPVDDVGLIFRPGPLEDRAAILAEMDTVGRYTVERWLVDSFFGNISCQAGGTLYISQTAASLGELVGQIDPVPLDGSSTAGITASSELVAHRRCYDACGSRTILHGHPKFPVVLSLLASGNALPMPVPLPIIGGETGAGGLADTLPPAIAQAGRALVRGHGVFAAGHQDFAEPFRAMLDIERWCRADYFRRLDGLE